MSGISPTVGISGEADLTNADGVLPVANGGTNASTASGARTSLGLGTIATQDANNVTISGGAITGITDLAVADGGTGASNASGARTNLGAAASGANSDLTALTGVTGDVGASGAGTSGIYFGAGTEKLSIYDEGTFTPAITFTTPGDLSVAYSTQVGVYTRIGNLVIGTLSIATSSFTHTTAAGALRVTGLPFTVVNTTGFTACGATQFQGITKANYTQFTLAPIINTTTASMNGSGSAQTLASAQVADVPTGGSVIIRATFAYQI